METCRAPPLRDLPAHVVYARVRNVCPWAQELFGALVRRLRTHTLIAHAPELCVLLPTPCAVLPHTPQLLAEVEARQARRAGPGTVTLVALVKSADFAFDAAQADLFVERYTAARVNLVVVDVSALYGPAWRAPAHCPIKADDVLDFACHGLCHRTALILPQPTTLVINDPGGVLDRLRTASDAPLVVLTSMDRLRQWWEGYCAAATPRPGLHVAVAMYHLQPDDPAVAELLADTSVRKTLFVTHKNLQIMDDAGAALAPDGVLLYGPSMRAMSELHKRHVWEPLFSATMDYPDFVARCVMSRVMGTAWVRTGAIPPDLLP